jgi:hypothetical protein
MRRAGAVLAGLLLATAAAAAQEAASRAWQQRLQIEIPLPVPLVEVPSVNPFALPVDTPATLLGSTAPRKIAVAGRAVVAAYVDAKGECLGAVPLELPFPGLNAAVVEEFGGSKFDAARSGNDPVPSWTVIEMVFESKVKESVVTEQVLMLPDPSAPPEPSVPERVSPSGNLLRLAATPAEELTERASPRRLKAKAAARDAEIKLTALVHISADGRCDRYVPLELASGLNPWLSAYLATWRLDPARRDGEPVDSWLVYSALVQMKLGSLQSSSFRTLEDRSYDPISVLELSETGG